MSEAETPTPVTQESTVFWAERVPEGTEAHGGYYLRSEVGGFIKRLNKAGLTVAAIRYDADDPHNLEFIVTPLPVTPPADDVRP